MKRLIAVALLVLAGCGAEPYPPELCLVISTRIEQLEAKVAAGTATEDDLLRLSFDRRLFAQKCVQ